MKTFLWGVIREAILSGSPEAVAYAAELLAKKLPFTADKIQAFLTACVYAAVQFGDGWVEKLAKSMLAPLFAGDNVGCDSPDCPCEVADYADVVAGFREVA